MLLQGIKDDYDTDRKFMITQVHFDFDFRERGQNLFLIV